MFGEYGPRTLQLYNIVILNLQPTGTSRSSDLTLIFFYIQQIWQGNFPVKLRNTGNSTIIDNLMKTCEK